MSPVCFGQWTAQLDFRLPGPVRDGLYILGALLFVTLLIVIWAVFYRKKPSRRIHRHRHHHHHQHDSVKMEAPSSTPPPGAVGEPEVGVEKGKGSRRSRRRERPLNPTLAQTRGLPPIRDESTPPAGL